MQNFPSQSLADQKEEVDGYRRSLLNLNCWPPNAQPLFKELTRLRELLDAGTPVQKKIPLLRVAVQRILLQGEKLEKLFFERLKTAKVVLYRSGTEIPYRQVPFFSLSDDGRAIVLLDGKKKMVSLGSIALPDEETGKES